LNNIVVLKTGLEITQGHWRWYHSKDWVRCPIRDKASYWSKIASFSYPLHSAHPLGGHCRNIAKPFGTEKPQWCGHPKVKKSLMTYFAVSTRYRRVTDRQTSCNDIVRAVY